ncbi:hypothetical protein F2Q70_00022535 [Brassica cretica]|uniref:Uncharacterized protein n=1 Tax=Brassica cretica TaxID=69181 RepID=A0A8S9HKU9_BRACR|nr:hypothetical protein F2Q70_00022535 [Brassica cretica]KAF2558629.1 hypothetical protein F2Q68_00016702 [Brassica cretica]
MSLKPMKTVRADEFTSRHSEDSIRSMAARNDEQMSFFLSTIDQIDEVKFVDTLGIYRVFGFSDWIL